MYKTCWDTLVHKFVLYPFPHLSFTHILNFLIMWFTVLVLWMLRMSWTCRTDKSNLNLNTDHGIVSREGSTSLQFTLWSYETNFNRIMKLSCHINQFVFHCRLQHSGPLSNFYALWAWQRHLPQFVWRIISWKHFSSCLGPFNSPMFSH